MIDITNLKILKENSNKNNTVFELLENHSKIVIVKIDAKLCAEYVSPSMMNILGYSPEYFMGNSVMDVVHEDDRPELEKEISETIRIKGKILDSEYRVRTKFNKVLWVETIARIFYNNHGQFDGAVYIQSDVTERKQQENQLKAALKEKDYLMKELNHRVKNNLAMVSSLISLKESETRIDLSSLKRRIEVIASVHEKLHLQNDIEQIEVKGYFQDLLESVFSFSSDQEINIVNKCEEFSIHTKIAIPLGLIVNEIATNAIKYGFSRNAGAQFTVKLTKNDENTRYLLTLSNTGNPFPEDFKIEESKTLGLQLIYTLVSQLKGTVELQKKPYPLFTIRFPIEEEQ